MSHTILIVGASRGIGAELARQFSTLPDYNIIATGRSSIPPESSTNIRFIKLDQTSAESVAAASKGVEFVDILVLNAAIGDEEYMETTSDERLQEYLVSNVVGPHRVIREFLPALMRGSLKKIILVSSTSGSLANQVKGHQGFAGPYSVSKAAGNMLVVQYQNELRQKGFCVAAVHPGWQQTWEN
ncbi:hypothetical protein NM208_g5913 [Fusarium decemcellulare]|uniref:Uncharacterized protein n=1 Tax=Fusarium decemcellulare TaxID=57161 RepID=A0ACC1SF45_9HYPO|nr:hypothetical protein NM208_g5913 [Fusarium decemcellulare]